MRPKKAKKQKPIVHTTFPFSEQQRNVLTDALDLLMNCEGFSFDDAKISEDSAFAAVDKLDCGDYTLTRGEVRATAKAVELAIQAIGDDPAKFEYLETEFPGLMSNLKTNATTLQALNQWLDAVVKDLRKMK